MTSPPLPIPELMYCESFDGYGSDTALMLTSQWIFVPPNVELVTTAKGTKAALIRNSTVSRSEFIVSVSPHIDTIMAANFTFSNLPTATSDTVPSQLLFGIGDPIESERAVLYLQTTGILELWVLNWRPVKAEENPQFDIKVATSDFPVITAGASHYIEMKVTQQIKPGSDNRTMVIVYVDGVRVFSYRYDDNPFTVTAVAKVSVGVREAVGFATGVDELLIENLNVIAAHVDGNVDEDAAFAHRTVEVIKPTSNSNVVAEWSWNRPVFDLASLITEQPPDDVTGYVFGGLNTSHDFELTLLPDAVTYIEGLIVKVRMISGFDAIGIGIVKPNGDANAADATANFWKYEEFTLDLDIATDLKFTPADISGSSLLLIA